MKEKNQAGFGKQKGLLSNTVSRPQERAFGREFFLTSTLTLSALNLINQDTNCYKIGRLTE